MYRHGICCIVSYITRYIRYYVVLFEWKLRFMTVDIHVKDNLNLFYFAIYDVSKIICDVE